MTSAEEVVIRRATRADVPKVVDLLADDDLGAEREKPTNPLAPSYYAAFDEIDSDPNNELVVADLEGELVATLQLTFLPYLTHGGSRRAQIEGVRVHRSLRGSGLGSRVIRWAISRARERGCRIVQLTSDKRRDDAIRFYEQLGFRPTHEGLKLFLDSPANGRSGDGSQLAVEIEDE